MATESRRDSGRAPDERTLARLLRRAAAARERPAPSFDALWEAAQQRAYSRRRRTRLAAAALVAALAAGLLLDAPRPPAPGRDAPLPQHDLLNAARLLETTHWEAPSDVLLPARERDIYRDLPALEVSTEGNEGALL